MRGFAYSLLCRGCDHQHDPALTCEQAALVRMGRCDRCGLVHGHRTCAETDQILRRVLAAPAADGRDADTRA